MADEEKERYATMRLEEASASARFLGRAILALVISGVVLILLLLRH